MVEVGGRIMEVNEVGKIVEVGGEIMEVDEVGDEVPQVGATGLGATGFQDHGSGREPPLILGTTGVEAGRVDAHEEGKFVKRLRGPRLRTEEEVEHHRLTHLPYRNWCPECVKAKGKDLDHRGQ